MPRTYTVVAALVVVLVALVFVWRLGCGSSSESSGGDGSGGSSGDLASSSKFGSRRGAGARAAPAALSGRVTRASDGTGIPGAIVSLAKADLGAMFSRGAEPTTIAITDATGAWTVPALPPSTYHVAASAVGFLPSIKRKLVVAAGSRETLDLALVAGGTTVSGTVLDIGGGPIGGVRVTARPENRILAAPAEFVAMTGPDGKYQLTLADDGYSATATHDDYSDSVRRFQLRGEPLTIDFKLAPGGSIRGQVVTADGTPVSGAMITSENTNQRFRGRDEPVFADDAGNFVLAGLDSGALALSAVARGYASNQPTIVELGIGEHVTGIRVVVDRALSVSGRVVKAGKPTEGIPGVRLGLFNMTGQFALAIDPTLDDGSFEVVGVKPASYMVFALGDQIVPEIGKPVDVIDKDVTGVIIELAAGVTLSGRIDPAAIATLGLELQSERIGIDSMFEMMKAVVVRADSDPTGAFTLRAVPRGKFYVVAKTKDGSEGKLAVEVADNDQTGLVIKLEPRASIAGKVVDERGTPVAGMRVNATADVAKRDGPTMSFDRDNDTALTGSNGAFRIVGLEPGKYKLSATDDDIFSRFSRDDKHSQTVELTAAQALTGVTLTIEARDGVIRGLVVDATGKPVGDAWVTPHFKLEKTVTVVKADLEDLSSFGPRGDAVLTGPDGRFVADRLRRGTYRLEVEGPRGASRATKKDVKTGDTVTITLEALGTLSGRVTMGTTPVTPYDLSCTTPTKRFEGDGGRRFANPDGGYHLERLSPGEYTCHVNATAGQATGKVTIASGPATLDMTLVPWGSITGKVTSIDGKPMAGLMVTVTGENMDKDMFRGVLSGKAPTTDDSGRFLVEKVPAGKVEVIVFSKDAAFQVLAKKELTVAAGQRVDAGTIKVVPQRTDDAGTLGFSTAIDDDKLMVGVVKDDGPAAAGVAMGDRITSIDGKPVAHLGVETAQQLIAPGAVAIGQKVTLGLERAGKPLTATVVAVKW